MRLALTLLLVALASLLDAVEPGRLNSLELASPAFSHDQLVRLTTTDGFWFVVAGDGEPLASSTVDEAELLTPRGDVVFLLGAQKLTAGEFFEGVGLGAWWQGSRQHRATELARQAWWADVALGVVTAALAAYEALSPGREASSTGRAVGYGAVSLAAFGVAIFAQPGPVADQAPALTFGDLAEAANAANRAVLGSP